MASTVVVTGASGFIAGEVIKQLLEKGYNVRGTVRSTANKEKTEHLTALKDSLAGKLELVEADLMHDGSFDEILDGAQYLFHTASPFFNSADDPQKELVDPALKGTRNVMNAAAKHKTSLKRVVLTSSLAAMLKMRGGPDKPPRYTESDWNTESDLNKEPYMYSKTVAEKAAWEIAEKEGIDLVTIHPGFVVGPIASKRSDGTSIQTIKSILESKDVALFPWFCDVRDVGRAHVRAAEIKSAKGRYLVTQPETVNFRDLSTALQERFPHLKIKELPDEPSKPACESTRALKELGLGALRPPTEGVVDMAITMVQRGIVTV